MGWARCIVWHLMLISLYRCYKTKLASQVEASFV